MSSVSADNLSDGTGKREDGYLQLEDGSLFPGKLFGSGSPADGEVVFNTGMVGYPESLTDPSYRGQILAFTYPLIGNYGVPHFEKGSPHFESDDIQVRGVILSSLSWDRGHHKADLNLHEWMASRNICGIEGIDTRRLTKILRERGTMLGRIVGEGGEGKAFSVNDPAKGDLVEEVSVKETESIRPESDERAHVILIDCGCKRSIINNLRTRGVRITRVPYDADISDMKCDGIMISNGPGDPGILKRTIENVKKTMEADPIKPVAGICLGSQIMALAAGGQTYKLRFGHRSQNQPCNLVGTEKCVITSQNHGYAVDESSLPDGWKVWYRNMNDGSVEGIEHGEDPFFSVQFHPEASPGPTDSSGFFDSFLEVISRG